MKKSVSKSFTIKWIISTFFRGFFDLGTSENQTLSLRRKGSGTEVGKIQSSVGDDVRGVSESKYISIEPDHYEWAVDHDLQKITIFKNIEWQKGDVWEHKILFK